MRYRLTDKFKREIRNYLKFNKIGMDKFNILIGFNIKNILLRNKSINENHLTKIKALILIRSKLDVYNFNYELNFGKPIKEIKHPKKSKKLAEFIGIMLGDGNMGKNGITIALHKNEKEYLKFIKKMIYGLFGVDGKTYLFKNKQLCHLVVYSKSLVQLLSQYGLIPGSKTKNQVGIPDWIYLKKDFMVACMRGLVDTDGCVFWSGRDKAAYIGFCNKSKRLLADFRKISQNIGIPFTKPGEDRLCLYKIDHVRKYFNIVGFSNQKHAERYGAMR